MAVLRSLAPPTLAWSSSFTKPFPTNKHFISLLPSSSPTIRRNPCVRLFSECRSGDEPTPPPRHRKLVLYSKPGCCLCDNLKEKLQAVFMVGGQDSLSDIELEVRDISTRAEWEAAYQYEIPVLARVNEDDSEMVLPRLSPRLSIELIHKKLAAALS